MAADTTLMRSYHFENIIQSSLLSCSRLQPPPPYFPEFPTPAFWSRISISIWNTQDTSLVFSSQLKNSMKTDFCLLTTYYPMSNMHLPRTLTAFILTTIPIVPAVSTSTHKAAQFYLAPLIPLSLESTCYNSFPWVDTSAFNYESIPIFKFREGEKKVTK